MSNLEDALVVAGFLNSFIRHADAVKIANIAQIVNVIAPIQIRGDEVLIQSIFYPFEMFSRKREGMSLSPVVDGLTYEGKTNGQAHFIDASAILDEDRLQIFVNNRSLEEAMTVRLRVADRAVIALKSGEILNGPGPKAANSFKQPKAVMAHPIDDANLDMRISEGRTWFVMPPLSVAAMILRLDNP